MTGEAPDLSGTTAEMIKISGNVGYDLVTHINNYIVKVVSYQVTGAAASLSYFTRSSKKELQVG